MSLVKHATLLVSGHRSYDSLMTAIKDKIIPTTVVTYCFIAAQAVNKVSERA